MPSPFRTYCPVFRHRLVSPNYRCVSVDIAHWVSRLLLHVFPGKRTQHGQNHINWLWMVRHDRGYERLAYWHRSQVSKATKMADAKGKAQEVKSTDVRAFWNPSAPSHSFCSSFHFMHNSKRHRNSLHVVQRSTFFQSCLRMTSICEDRILQ